MLRDGGIFQALNNAVAGLGAALSVVAEKGLTEIRRRTLSGKDVRGKYFVGYSDKYKKRKGQSLVDLKSNQRVSSKRNTKRKHMLDSMIVDAATFSSFGGGGGRNRSAFSGRFESGTSPKASITFDSAIASKIAGAQISGKRTMGPRDFFGLSSAWLSKNVDAEYSRIFSQATSGIRNERLHINLFG